MSTICEGASSDQGTEGYRGITASADRSGAVSGILSLWDTQTDRDASESALADVRQEALGIVGGELSVETFEELVAEVNAPMAPGSALMITRVSMDPAKIDENFAFFKSDVLPRIKASAGYQGMRKHDESRDGARTRGHGVGGQGRHEPPPTGHVPPPRGNRTRCQLR